MKKGVKLFGIIVAIAFMAQNVKAQENSFGIKAGINYSTLKSVSGNNTNTSDSKIGFQIGGVYDFYLGKYFAIQPGLYFIAKGGVEKVGNIDITSSPYYLEIPILASLRYNFTKDFQLQLGAGPYAGIGLFGKMKSENSDGIDFFGDKVNTKSAGIKRFDMGLTFSGGVSYKNFSIALGYDLGLMNIANSDLIDLSEKFGSEYSIKTSCFFVNLGYNF